MEPTNSREQSQFSFTDGLLHTCISMSQSICHESVIAVERSWLSDEHRLLNAVTDDLDLVVECDETNLAIRVAFGHGLNLGLHSALAKFQAILHLHGTTDVDAEDDGDLV